MVTVEQVAAMVSELPEVVEGERYGHRTWSVAGKSFAWVRPFSKADLRRFGDTAPPEGPILAISVEDLAEKEAVLAADHEGFFTIEHFNGFAAVLVQLDVATEPALRTALVDGWLAVAPPKLAEAYLAQHDLGADD